MAYSRKVKRDLNDCIDYIAEHRTEYVKSPTDFTRNRKLPLKTLLKLILGFEGGTLNHAIREFFEYDKNLPTAAALIEQRAKLSDNVFPVLFEKFLDKSERKKKYKGYNLLAVDGTSVNLARNPKESSYIPPRKNTGDYNQLHLNVTHDILNNQYIAYEFQQVPIANERDALLNMAGEICVRYPNQKSLYICDRGYPSYHVIETINRLPNADFLLRMDKMAFNSVQDLPDEILDIDMDVQIRTTQTNEDKRAYAAKEATFLPGKSKKGKIKKEVSWHYESPCNVKYRIVKFPLSTGNWEVIATSLPRDKFSIAEIKELYHMRWDIEESFKSLKYTIGLTTLHSRKETFAIQEIIAKMICYNYVSRIVSVLGVIKECKYRYEVSFKDAADISRRDFKHGGKAPPEDLFIKYIRPIREGRPGNRKVIMAKSFVPFTYRVAA